MFGIRGLVFICDSTLESRRRDDLYFKIKQSYEQLQEEQKKELEYQEKLKLAVDEANRANQAKSSFLSHMSHDIRTPMNGIKGMLEIIRKERHNDERVDDCLNKIETASGYLLSLINDVLDMSKLESGEITLARIPFNLHELMDECHEILIPLALDRGVKLISDREKEIPHEHLIGSPLHVRQVILNIVSNAIKYTKPGGTVSCYLEEISDVADTAVYRFTVADTGIGMSQEFLPHVFEPFSQERDSSHTNYAGTGLGLAIVKRILDDMNGYVYVESELGVGSKFTFTMPFLIDNDPPVKEAADDGFDGAVKFSGVRLLLVEDNELNMEIAQFILEDSGATVDTASNGQIAVDKFSASEQGFYNAILMDVMMPVLDGLDATRAIRALDREDAKTIPIIAMTANAFLEDAAKCLDAGMNEHLTKPLDSELVIKTLGRYLESSQ